MAKQAREATGIKEMKVVADRGYFKGEEILSSHKEGITTYLPKPMTSPNQAKGLFPREAFRYLPEKNGVSGLSGWYARAKGGRQTQPTTDWLVDGSLSTLTC